MAAWWCAYVCSRSRDLHRTLICAGTLVWLVLQLALTVRVQYTVVYTLVNCSGLYACPEPVVRTACVGFGFCPFCQGYFFTRSKTFDKYATECWLTAEPLHKMFEKVTRHADTGGDGTFIKINA